MHLSIKAGMDAARIVTAIQPGDADGDDRVNFTDLLALASAYNGPGDWPNGDFTFDGLVNFSDLRVLAGNYGFAPPSGSPASAGWTHAALAPEPACIWALVLPFLITRRRR